MRTLGRSSGRRALKTSANYVALLATEEVRGANVCMLPGLGLHLDGINCVAMITEDRIVVHVHKRGTLQH